METAPGLEDGLATAGAGTTLVVDMTTTTYCDSWGLTVLVRQQNRLSATGGHLVIRNPPDMFRTLLAVCRLEEFLPVEPPTAG